ncbi:MAG: hypothetical protein OZ923_03975 [Comamonadaceae bacterium]|nr:hypothetical protein [Burkholderiales bacterium]MEB2347748.1 hypothetical protein [Comamonadaceae bacterium]
MQAIRHFLAIGLALLAASAFSQAAQGQPGPAATQPQTQQPETWEQRNERRNKEVAASSITRNGGRWDEKARAQREAERRKNSFVCTDTGGGTTVCGPEG